MSEGERGIERELKFPCGDLDGLRSRLIDCEAERVAPSAFEENLVFDRGGELAKSESLLRLRSDSQGARLTFKGPPEFEGGVKIRVEHETAVGDFESAANILQSLGYEAVRRYQKYREEWRLGGVVIALDHTPIGDFSEFEGAGADKVARRCHFDPDEAEPRNYLKIYEDHRAEHPDAPVDMIFT